MMQLNCVEFIHVVIALDEVSFLPTSYEVSPRHLSGSFIQPQYGSRTFRTSSALKQNKMKINSPWRELKTQKSSWKVKVAASMAKKPNTQVNPSNTDTVIAFWSLAYNSSFKLVSLNLDVFFLVWCMLYMMMVNVMQLCNMIRPMGRMRE